LKPRQVLAEKRRVDAGTGAGYSDTEGASAFAHGYNVEGEGDGDVEAAGHSSAGAGNGTGMGDPSIRNPKDPTVSGRLKQTTAAVRAGHGVNSRGSKGSSIATKLLPSRFPAHQPYSVIVRPNIELISVTLHRSQADLLLAYVYFQQGDGSGGEG
jgi:hypothetical protein